MSRLRAHWLSLVVCFLGLLVVLSPVAADEKDDEYYRLMEVFVDTFEQIDRSYVKDVDRRELMEAAIEGMLGKLDPYSSYISPEDLTRFTEDVEQEFGGIGIQVTLDPDTRRLTVVSPLPGTPAYKAGVKAGDVIVEIEGKSTKDFGIDDAVKALKGPPGKKVTIGVKHLGADDVETIELVRDIIHVPTVLGDRYKSDSSWDYWIDESHKVGYLRLTHFSRHSDEELKEALKRLKAEDMKGLILDLRFNPGGLLSQATAVADLFIESGKIVSTKGRNTREREWNATKEGTFTGFPMAVLVNRYSASASEIVSACLQDHERAVVVGERTWGKGSVQNVIELENGQSALKLTTASYHRPSGKNIHKFPGAKPEDEWGVLPNDGYKVKLTNEEMRDYLEYRRQRDVLSKKGPPQSDFVDRQLTKALDYIQKELGVSKAAEKPEKDGQKKAKPAGAAEAGRRKTPKDALGKRLRKSMRVPPVSAA